MEDATMEHIVDIVRITPVGQEFRDTRLECNFLISLS